MHSWNIYDIIFGCFLIATGFILGFAFAIKKLQKFINKKRKKL